MKPLKLNHTQAASPSPSFVTLLQHLLRRSGGDFAIRLWDGTELRSAPSQPPRFTLVCRTPAALRALMLGGDPLRLAEAYLRDDLDIEGDLFAAITLKDRLQDFRPAWHQRLRIALHTLMLPRAGGSDVAPGYRRRVRRHTPRENREAIAFHYDLSNDFYGLWLDPAMVYSCAYFERPDASLEQAQQAKLEHICRKLLLRPGERLLDVGCGWGALVIHAAQHHGVHAHGISLSRNQLEVARERIARAGLKDRVTVELRDYRELEGEGRYDKIASVGMFEHVGLRRLPLYFATVRRLLKPGGLFLNHGITNATEGWRTSAGTRFINRYIFPDGQLDTIGNIQRAMEVAGFEIVDVEALRRHYALTLRQWIARLESHHDEALRHVDESTYRAWRLYMAASALEFESGGIGIYQILASGRADGTCEQPLTRRHLYR
ncbi:MULTISPECIES: class I SAM-dependent methyltransferase [unclassified Pseudomonas]|uniref:class I SAM-dependent methyltransferase n=1 Tax=unclassified Pseudomonas TaxID=196821 RepID=UPI00244A0232|nr:MULTISPECIES: class I SAM-dependent methyltransferase [unclassified Pseudomonas]MDG9927574.1 class I SAM-dependent methyltransferase [Pseudomonas sp. GD04042]MDH0485323.1 class I SAM-dependent methyltransferase [Pseudomonas sp. GD04015]MDH0603805.1 class I SAM-dependent methyltransferase [Pseudomonas sp. GD03869]